jgi:beta-glucosidase
VRGYYHWTFTDNFEWSEGWGLRFGLIELNPATQERKPRPSAHMFADIARRNGIAQATVNRYAPELLGTLFPTPAQAAR